MTILTLIRRNLRQRLARNVALIFSVALVAALTTVFAAGRSFFSTSKVMLARPMLIVQPLYSYGAWLRGADTAKIAAVPHVVSVTRNQTYSTTDAAQTYGFSAFGSDETYFTAVNKDGVWFPTTPDMVERWRGDRTAFIVGETTAAVMGYQEGRQYELLTVGGPLMANCVGISRGGANKVNLVLHYDYVDVALGNREGRITNWLVEVDDMKNMESAKAGIEAIFDNAVIPVHVGPAGDHVGSQASRHQSIVNMLGLVCVLVFVVTMFITLNTVLFLVRERRQSLAAMRAIGFRSGHVFRLVALEVIVLCLLGGLVGIGVVLLYFRSGIPFGDGNLLVTIHPMAAVAGAAVTAVIGVVASVIPSWLASRVDILAALRST